MKKEIQIHTTVEIVEILPNLSLSDAPIEVVKEQVKQRLIAKFLPLSFDNINIANMQVFEIEKEERISTEDLIKGFKHCTTEEDCTGCVFEHKCPSCAKLEEMVIGRLEELNQQTATPTEQPKAKNTKKEYVLNNLHLFGWAKEENINEDNILGYCPSDFGFANTCNTYNSCAGCWNSPCEKDGGEE